MSYVARIRSLSPVAYWRLGDAPGAVRVADEIATRNGTPAGGVTFGDAGALTADPDTAASFDGMASIQDGV